MTDKNFERLGMAIELLAKIHPYIAAIFWAYILVCLYGNFFGTLTVVGCVYGYMRLVDWMSTNIANWAYPPRDVA